MAFRMNYLIFSLIIVASNVIVLLISHGGYHSAYRYLTTARQPIWGGLGTVKNISRCDLLDSSSWKCESQPPTKQHSAPNGTNQDGNFTRNHTVTQQGNGGSFGPINLSNTTHDLNSKSTKTPSSHGRDDSRLTVNPHDYSLLLDEPHACYDAAGSPREVFLLVLITTLDVHIEHRKAVRETFGSSKEVRGKQIVTLFLLARTQDASLQRQVEEESRKYHDLIQEDFQDTYRNLTLKTIMGMKWASTRCPHASYVMKTDDDIFVNYDLLIKHLNKASSTNYAVGCLRKTNLHPSRDPRNKGYVSRQDYPGSTYPPYPTGAGYVVSGDLVGKIYRTSLNLKYLSLEDVYMGLCLRSLNIRPVDSSQFTCWLPVLRPYCRSLHMITLHRIAPPKMYQIWSRHQRQIKCKHLAV